MKKWKKAALEMGFTSVSELDPSTLHPEPFVRDMCAADKCHAYGWNWTCPPACGTLEECRERLLCYRRGLLLQTTEKLSGPFDAKGVVNTERRHLQAFHQFSDQIRREHPDALCLGSGGCRICGQCAYPDPCRFPDRAYSSMEGYGLFVTRVCRDNQVPYHYGENTITYTACVLLP